MKKIYKSIVVILILVLSFNLIACGKKAQVANGTNNSENVSGNKEDMSDNVEQTKEKTEETTEETTTEETTEETTEGTTEAEEQSTTQTSKEESGKGSQKESSQKEQSQKEPSQKDEEPEPTDAPTQQKTEAPTEKPTEKPTEPQKQIFSEAELCAKAEAMYSQNLSYYKEVLRLTNVVRAEAGVEPLQLDATVCKAATMRAIEMDYADYFAHTRANGDSWTTALEYVGMNTGYRGENIAAGYRTPADVVDG